jgi:hypothetical protein
MQTSPAPTQLTATEKDRVRPRRGRAASSGSRPVLVLLLAHVPLGLLLQSNTDLATFHALIVGGLGLLLALFGKRAQSAAYVAAYAVGAEVLWRMTEARVYWEAGKYLVVAVLGLAALRFSKGLRGLGLPGVYLLILLPSTWLTIEALGFSDAARDAISFNLSGPLALAVSVAFFAGRRFSHDQIRRLMWLVVCPMVSIATIALYGALNDAEAIHFTEGSNFVTSGGFGPNQVSAVLGLGALLCVFLAAQEPPRALKLVALALAVWFLAQSALTLSRGGLATAGVALLLGAIHYVRRPREQVSFMASTLLIVFVFGYLILPQLNAFTGDILRQRFSDVDPTGRIEIAQSDLHIWSSHPLLGVGPGRSAYDRSSVIVEGTAAHTEFTRLAAEHGVMGLLAMLLLGVMLWRAYKRAPSVPSRAWVVALASWSLVDMSHSAMRIVAISFIFGLMTLDSRPATRREKPSMRRSGHSPLEPVPGLIGARPAHGQNRR